MHFAELGVVMMLFLVGLELRPALLWELRRPILGLGGLQVGVSALALAAAAFAFGLGWKPSLAVGLILALSSTAIVLSSLAERGLLETRGGRASLSVLLFQDVAVIPILAILPLLAAAASATGAAAERPAWISALLVLGAVGVVVVAGRFVVRPVFRFLARVRLRESFTAFALLLVVGIALLMQQVGLSPALGTFLAGVLLADSEYRHELQGDVEPFKGLLLGLFFISVGAQIDFGRIVDAPATIAGIVGGTLVLKAGVLLALAAAFGLDRPARWLLALALPQVGEFGFVLLSFAERSRVFGAEIASPLVASVAISMLLTPLLFVALERWVLPAVTGAEPEREADELPASDAHVVIAGHGRFGQIVGRILRANRIPTTVLDLDPEIVDALGRIGIKVHYGDASRLELLHAAGCERARLFVLAIDDPSQAVEIARVVRQHFPQLPIVARARDRVHYRELRHAGVSEVHRELFAASWEAGIAALRALGYRAHTAHRLARRWRDHEERDLHELMELWGTDRDRFFARSRLAIEEAERLMSEADAGLRGERDAGWDDETLRGDATPDAATRGGGEPRG
jgi:Kef-type K+ transport system membrane component KefB/voltage-gated potassium channel Kch